MVQPTFSSDEGVQRGGFAQGRKGGGQKKGVQPKIGDLYCLLERIFAFGGQNHPTYIESVYR